MDAMQYSFSIDLLNIAFNKAGSNPNSFTVPTVLAGLPADNAKRAAKCKIHYECVLYFLSLISSAGHVQVLRLKLLISHLRNSPFNYHYLRLVNTPFRLLVKLLCAQVILQVDYGMAWGCQYFGW